MLFGSLIPRGVQNIILCDWLSLFQISWRLGSEITGQTNEFNELSQTQSMSLAIWTPIKGYGQVS